MFTIKDVYFILDKTNQDRVFYKNGTFYCYDYDDFSTYEKLDNLYYTDFVYMSKLSYYIRKSFKDYNFDLLKKMINYLNFIDFCENLNNEHNLNIDYKLLLNKKSFPNYNINKLNKLFIENEKVNKVLLKLIYIRNEEY